MKWEAWVLIGFYYFLAGFTTVTMIGKKRKPTTFKDALPQIFVIVILLFVLLLGVLIYRLGTTP